MIAKRWIGRSAVVLVALLVVAAFITGCGSSKSAEQTQPQTKPGASAKDGLQAAQSALSTMAPDAKLLIVQTAQAVTPTATPVWAYLFGSPKNDKVYIVYLTNGQSMGAQEYAKAGMTAEEWKTVPDTAKWKIDSPEALTKALAVSGAKGEPNAYMMGFITYKSKADTSTVQPFVWNIQFDPGASGATTQPIDVNAETGEAKVVGK